MNRRSDWPAVNVAHTTNVIVHAVLRLTHIVFVRRYRQRLTAGMNYHARHMLTIGMARPRSDDG